MKELEQLASSVKTELNLKYDAESVKVLESFIERNKADLNEEQAKGLINSLGSFLGQCIIENYGGQWLLDTEAGAIAIAFDEKNKAFPFAKVSKQFENGLEDSVYSFYMIIPTVFNLSEKKKPW